MQKKRKIGLLFLILITSIIAISYFALSFAPESYSRAEIYELKASEKLYCELLKV